MNLFKKTYGFPGNGDASQAVVNRLASDPVAANNILLRRKRIYYFNRQRKWAGCSWYADTPDSAAGTLQ